MIIAVEIFSNMSKSFLIIGFILLIFSVDLSAQKGWEAGGWIGGAIYYGDLNSSINLKGLGIAGGVNSRYNYNNRISAKGSFNFGRIKADDANSSNNFEKARNLSFHSNIFDLTGIFEFNFLPYVHGSKKYYYTPYLGAGLSIFRYNPKAELNGTTYSLRDFGTEGQGQEYGSFSGGLTIVAGWKWDLSYDLSLNIEASYRRLLTDYLDDVSQTYPDNATLLAQRGQIAVDLSDRTLVDGISGLGRQRGNSKDNDTYSFIGISLMKYFGRLECPKISEIR